MFLKLDKVLALKGMRCIQEAVSKIWFEEIFALIVHTHYERIKMMFLFFVPVLWLTKCCMMTKMTMIGSHS